MNLEKDKLIKMKIGMNNEKNRKKEKVLYYLKNKRNCQRI